MKFDCDIEVLLNYIYDEDKAKREKEERQKQIDWEWVLYKSYCRLHNLRPQKYESLVLFNYYRKLSGINLI